LRALADVDLETLSAGRDRQPLVAELADDVEGLADRLFEGEPQGVRRDRAFDLGADVLGGLEEAICRHEPIERLVRPLEVVVRQVVHEPLLRVDRVSEDRAAEELVPQRLPEALDLAQRLRMLRPTPDVVNAHPPECLFEFGLAAPHRVLPAVIGQHLSRLAVRRDAVLERLHHQCRLLVVCERVPHDEAAVVVHEDAHVQSLRAPQPKREDVRLPELVRRRTFEAPRSVLPRRRRRRCLDQPLSVEDLPDLLLRHAERLEAREHVADSARAPELVFTLQRHHLVANDWIRPLPRSVRAHPARLEPVSSTRTERLHPLRDRRLRHLERRSDVLLLRPA